jgi:hypothetical protein
VFIRKKLSHNGLPVDGAPVAVGILETMSETPEGRNVHTCIYLYYDLFLTLSEQQEVVVVVRLHMCEQFT